MDKAYAPPLLLNCELNNLLSRRSSQANSELFTMTTDLVFDFFGTLVQYASGPFHTAPYSQTHDFLLHQNFVLRYEEFTTAFETASHELEERAQLTGQEYHMDELGRRFFRTAFAAEVPDDLVRAFVTVFLLEWGRGIVYLEGLAPFLKRLAASYRLSVLSNTSYPPLIHTHLAAMSISHHFAAVFTSVEIGIRKPHALVFRHALEQLNVTTANAVYIGDSFAADYQGATGAGLKCILIDPLAKHLDVVTRVNSLFGLEQHL